LRSARVQAVTRHELVQVAVQTAGANRVVASSCPAKFGSRDCATGTSFVASPTQFIDLRQGDALGVRIAAATQVTFGPDGLPATTRTTAFPVKTARGTVNVNVSVAGEVTVE
jgi:hypothetical protein